MKATKEFPRSFKSSSAAYRAIRQWEEKMGLKPNESGLVMTKIDKKDYLVSKGAKKTFAEFMEVHPNVIHEGLTYRFFPDGVSGSGYYELKTGDRRRPNSKFLTSEFVYTETV